MLQERAPTASPCFVKTGHGYCSSLWESARVGVCHSTVAVLCGVRSDRNVSLLRWICRSARRGRERRQNEVDKLTKKVRPHSG